MGVVKMGSGRGYRIWGGIVFGEVFEIGNIEYFMEVDDLRCA